MAGYADRADPGFHAVTNWVIAAMAAAAAGWVGWMLGWPWVVDFDDPDFNPLLILEGILIGVAGWHVVKALRWRARARAFGVTGLQIDGRTPVPLGGALAGRLVLGRPVVPTGPWVLELTCHDVHETRDTRSTAAGPYRRESFPVWSTQVTLPAGTDTTDGLRFRIQLPQGVGPKPVPPLQRKRANVSFTASVNIPGMRRVISHNAPPVDRFWTLKVTAPTGGPTFEAEYRAPVEI